MHFRSAAGLRHALALSALVLLCGCTATDTGWHLALGFRDSGDNFMLDRLSKRPLPAGAIVAGSGGETLRLQQAPRGAGPDFRRASRGSGPGFQRASRGAEPDTAMEPEQHFARFGGLERHIPAQPWRGRKVRIQLRLRNENNAMAFVMAQVNRMDGGAIRTVAQGNAPNESGWRSHALVMEVPDNASYLFVYAGFTGGGEFWLDGLKVDTAPADAPLSEAYGLTAANAIGCSSSFDCGPITPYSWTPNRDPNPPYVPPPEPPPPPPPPPSGA